MKISKIHISKYHQFEDFELDLTYPNGHEKEGQPLDKVCFIGQSGTGKTTLLELIKYASTMATPFASPDYKLKSPDFEKKQWIYFKFQNNEVGDFEISIGSNGAASMNRDLEKPIIDSILSFPVGLSNINLSDNDVSQNPINLIVAEPEVVYEKNSTWFFQLDIDTIKDLWRVLYKHVQNYQTKEANFRIGLTKQIESGEQNINFKEKIEKWKTENPNPLELVAKDCLDVVLNRFHLKTKTEIDDIREINALQIYSTSEDKTIPYNYLSTGTKQIIFTAFPIFQLLNPNSIVLMDEPENSLYPDIQKEIIDYYTSFDKEKKSQFFFATHSPIIASSFEPWEIVELKFDKNGKVYRDIYYEGENHVDNYRLDPQILRYDQILTRIFDLSRGSDKKRSEKMQELTILKDKVKHFSKEEIKNPSPKNKELIEKYLRLADDLSGTWAITKHEKN